MNLPGVVAVEFVIVPTPIGDFRVGDFRVVDEYGVFEEQVGNTVTGLQAAALNGLLLVTTTCADARLVFVIVAEESAKLEIVRTGDQREVIFPDVKIFAVLPRSLVPDVCVSTHA